MKIAVGHKKSWKVLWGLSNDLPVYRLRMSYNLPRGTTSTHLITMLSDKSLKYTSKQATKAEAKATMSKTANVLDR